MSDKVIKGGNGDPKDANERHVQAPVEHRPFLTPQELVASLKARGVKFELCSEEDAAAYLREHNNYLRCASYRVLFDRKPAAEDGTPGPYVNLDFEHLRDLSSLDRQLREAFLDVCIDVEHFAKLYVLNRAQAEGEDGYAIVADYLNQLDYQRRRYVSRSLAVRSRGGRTHDEYKGDLIAHHLENLSLWVFLEVVDFGTFVDLYRFCAGRWGDDVMAQEHYVLKSVKSLRHQRVHQEGTEGGIPHQQPSAQIHERARHQEHENPTRQDEQPPHCANGVSALGASALLHEQGCPAARCGKAQRAQESLRNKPPTLFQDQWNRPILRFPLETR